VGDVGDVDTRQDSRAVIIHSLHIIRDLEVGSGISMNCGLCMR
jgi:hypothetical protein